MRKIFPEGKWPSQAQLSSLSFDPDGFSWWLQDDKTAPMGATIHVVVRSHDRGGSPVIRTAGMIPLKHVTYENPGVAVAVMAGEYSRHTVPTLHDAYELIKSSWALSL